MKKLNVVMLYLMDWSASLGGEHYYATLKYYDKNGKYQIIELTNILTQKMATYLNKKERCDSYSKGDESLRFDTSKDAIKVALRKCKELGVEVDLILTNSPFGSVSEALWGDKRIVKRINQLYEKANEIGWYSHPKYPVKEQDDKMSAIDMEFHKLIGKNNERYSR